MNIQEISELEESNIIPDDWFTRFLFKLVSKYSLDIYKKINEDDVYTFVLTRETFIPIFVKVKIVKKIKIHDVMKMIFETDSKHYKGRIYFVHKKIPSQLYRKKDIPKIKRIVEKEVNKYNEYIFMEE